MKAEADGGGGDEVVKRLLLERRVCVCVRMATYEDAAILGDVSPRRCRLVK